MDKKGGFKRGNYKIKPTEEMNFNSALAKEILLEIFNLFEKASWI